jgi:hypothetical protein
LRPAIAVSETRGDALPMAQQVQGFFCELEKLGLAEPRADPAAAANAATDRPVASITLEMLRSLAPHFGYRIT